VNIFGRGDYEKYMKIAINVNIVRTYLGMLLRRSRPWRTPPDTFLSAHAYDTHTLIYDPHDTSTCVNDDVVTHFRRRFLSAARGIQRRQYARDH
jgi:hypothetical protein